MSEPEQEQEPQEGAETPQEPLQGDELAPDEEEAEEAEETPEEPAEEPEPEQPAGMSEKAMEATRKKLDNENARHRGRITDLIGEEALLLEPCPLCNGFADGYRFDVIPPEDVITATLVAVGFGDVRDLEPASDAKQCGECKGKGRTKTGALLGEFASKKCATCKGIGWTKPDGTPAMGQEAPSGAGDVLTAPNGSDPDLEPLVDALRAKGFSVFPPTPVLTGPTAQ